MRGVRSSSSANAPRAVKAAAPKATEPRKRRRLARMASMFMDLIPGEDEAERRTSVGGASESSRPRPPVPVKSQPRAGSIQPAAVPPLRAFHPPPDRHAAARAVDDV